MIVRCAHTEMVDVDLLVPHPLNPNKHGEKQIEMLAKIMKHQGWRHPITVSKRSGFIVAGHGRLMAAKKLGWTSAPIDRQEFETEADEYAHLIADNKIAELAEHDDLKMFEDLKKFPDLDLDLLGIPDLELPSLEVVPGCDADEVPEAMAEPKVVRGEVYILGRHRLMCGDSTSIDDVERLMDGEKADMLFTSPPYSDQRTYNGDKDLSVSNLKGFISAFRSWSDLFAVNLGLKRSEGAIIRYWDEYIEHAEQCDLKLLSWNIWDRSGEGGSIGAMTAQFPIQHEFIFVFGNEIETNRFLPNKSAGRSTKTTIRQSDGTLKKSHGKAHDFGKLGTVLKTELDKGKSDVKHPAKFPVSLPENYILACTSEGDLVAEPFGGSGSTLIACEKTERICSAMELDPLYCGIILDRWQKFTGQQATREDGKLWDEIRGA